jgi:hypothetical protein
MRAQNVFPARIEERQAAALFLIAPTLAMSAETLG